MPASTADNLVPTWIAPEPTKEELEWADIKTIDLSKFDDPAERKALVETVREALSTYGFFKVVGHTFRQDEITRLFSLGLLPFTHVPDSEKRLYEAPIATEGSFIGYKLPAFWEIENGVRDRITHYNFYTNSIDPETRHPPALRPHLDEIKRYVARSRQDILRKVLILIAQVLELPDEYLWHLHESESGEKGEDLYRFMLYEPLQADEAEKTGNVMLKGHTDFNTVSILYSQPIASLQILMPDGKWRYVKHVDNGLVVNIGDQLSFLTGGFLKATIHRVITPPADQRHLNRLGVFHFAHALGSVPLKPLIEDSPVVAQYAAGVAKEKGWAEVDPWRDDEAKRPTSHQWERDRIRSYGRKDLTKGEKWDTETINGVDVKHYR